MSISCPAAAIFIFSFVLICNSLPTTYDQRQDGELNVRADLQNVVIVALIPKTDVASNLLEYVLTKSGVTPQQRRRAVAKRHRIKAATKPDLDEDFQDPETEIQDRSDVRSPEVFVEPKTPYKVDISEAKKHYQRFHQNEQKTRSSGVGKSSLHRRKSENPEIEDDTPVPIVIPVKNNRYVRTESSANDGEKNIEGLQSVADFPKYVGSKDNNSIPDNNKDNATVNEDNTSKEDTSLKLIGATEQCAPDQNRDQYGICQFVKEAVDPLTDKTS